MMAQPSSIQVLGGTLAGLRLELRGRDLHVGSAADCALRLDAPGVERHHARIVIDISGATLYRGDGVVGVNDDVVSDQALLRSGDFIWIGEPGGDSSMMLQFTSGDIDDASQEPSSEATAAEPPAAADDPLVEELLEPAALEVASEPEAVEYLELTPESLEEAPPTLEAASASPPSVPTEIEFITDLDPAFEPPDEIPASSPSVREGKVVVPPAPWQTPLAATAAPGSEPIPPPEYASAWESPTASPAPSEAPAPEAGDETIQPKSPTPARTQTPPTRLAAVTHAAKRPPPTPPVKPTRPHTGERAASPRTPPPLRPVRAVSNTPAIVGGVAALFLVAVGGYYLNRPAATPVAPRASPQPSAVVASTPVPTPEAIPESIETALAEPASKVLAPPVVAGSATPRAAATSAPRASSPPGATPATMATRPAGPAPKPAAPIASAAPVSQAPRLLGEARAAVAARDLPKALQLLDQLLTLEPGNGEATTQKAEVTARLASLNRKFSIGTTSVQGGKAAQGPAGFDLGDGGVVQTDLSAQIRCTTNPASLEPGMAYTLSCRIVNLGAKAFRLDKVVVNETLDGAQSASAGTAPRGDIVPQGDGAILQRSGTWSAKTRWSIEIIAKTKKVESFRAVYTWR